MSAPDHLDYSPHGETDDDRPVVITSYFRDGTIPNDPCTDMGEAQDIVIHHVEEFVAADTEDIHIRASALDVDLGFRANRHGFACLVDTYRSPTTPVYRDIWYGELETYLQGHGLRKARP